MIVSLSRILGVPEEVLISLDASMSKATGKSGTLTALENSIQTSVRDTLGKLGVQGEEPIAIKKALREAIFAHEKQLLDFLNGIPGSTEFEKAATLAKMIAPLGRGFFLRKEFAEQILKSRLPANVLSYFKVNSVDGLLKKHDVLEVFSALRFMESNEWMHETFKEAYKNFTATDFEEREIKVEVLGPAWQEVAAQFVAKKHHNVSHLKEFGVIFINPIREDLGGKFLRDFALLFHYFHEVHFYAKLFKRYSEEPNFPKRFASLLRGDVIGDSPSQIREGKTWEGNWFIIQRYLVKENPADPRLFLPRVNPESLHWARGERDLVEFGAREAKIDLEFWRDLDWVAAYFNDELVSFDLEDNAMSAVSYNEGKEEFFTYHQKEALWTKLFSMYVRGSPSHISGGETREGEEAMEKLLIENFDEGVIQFEA